MEKKKQNKLRNSQKNTASCNNYMNSDTKKIKRSVPSYLFLNLLGKYIMNSLFQNIMAVSRERERERAVFLGGRRNKVKKGPYLRLNGIYVII